MPLVPRPHSSPLLSGIHHQPNSTHLGSFSECFLCSAAFAEIPWYMPASTILSELSGDATVAEVPQSQLVTRMSAGHVLE